MKLILSILLSLLSLNLFAADGGLGTVSGTTTVGTIPAGNLPALGVAYPNALTNNSTVAWTNTDNITALTFSGAGSGQGILSLSNAAATGLTVILGPSNAFANAAFFSNSIVAPFWKDPTNAATSNYVLTATSTSGDTAWKVGGSTVPPLVSPSGFTMTANPGARVLLNEEFEQQAVNTLPNTLAGQQTSGFVAGTATEVSSNHTGVLLMMAGTNAGAYTDISSRPGAVVFSTADWYIEYAIAFTNTDAHFALTNGWARLGWNASRSELANASDAAYAQLQVDNWQLVTANGTTKTTNSTSTPGWTTAWQTIGIYSPWPNTNFMLYVNGTPIATNTSNVPNGLAHATTARAGMAASANGLGAAGTLTNGMYLDYIWMAISPHSWP